MDNNVTNQQRPKPSILKSECHLHLYGCLSLKDLWQLGEERSNMFPERFQWFLSTYHKQTGVQLTPKIWWDGRPDAYEIFREQIAVLDASPFATFQAKFNLLIALFPPHPEDLTLARAVFAHDQNLGGYKEYRTFLPLYLNPEDRTRYLKNLLVTAQSFATGSYHPRLAISIVRQDAEAIQSYEFLDGFLKQNPEFSTWITGIDFCGDEAHHPPSAKKLLFQKIHNDNRTRPQPLAILYHVGEMWSTISLHSAARWCVEAAQTGSHRLGHALALGLNPLHLKDVTLNESMAEWQQHIDWMEQNKLALNDFGFTDKHMRALQKIAEDHCHNGNIVWKYNETLLALTQQFQNALLQFTKIINPVIECCLSSNIRIAELRDPRHHPLQEFIKHNLPITLSTDDPGLFDVTLDHEERLAVQHFQVSDTFLNECEQRTVGLLSGH